MWLFTCMALLTKFHVLEVQPCRIGVDAQADPRRVWKVEPEETPDEDELNAMPIVVPSNSVS